MRMDSPFDSRARVIRVFEVEQVLSKLKYCGHTLAL